MEKHSYTLSGEISVEETIRAKLEAVPHVKRVEIRRLIQVVTIMDEDEISRQSREAVYEAEGDLIDALHDVLIEFSTRYEPTDAP